MKSNKLTSYCSLLYKNNISLAFRTTRAQTYACLLEPPLLWMLGDLCIFNIALIMWMKLILACFVHQQVSWASDSDPDTIFSSFILHWHTVSVQPDHGSVQICIDRPIKQVWVSCDHVSTSPTSKQLEALFRAGYLSSL